MNTTTNDAETASNQRERKASDWSAILDDLEGLGLKLKLHAKQARSEERTGVDSAVQNLSSAIEDAFTALRGVVSDPAVAEDVKSLGTSIAHAVVGTLKNARESIEEHWPSQESESTEEER